MTLSRTQLLAAALAAVLAAVLLGCGAPGEAGPFDAGADDSGSMGVDAGAGDAGAPDAGAADGGTDDAGETDAGAQDAGGTDAGGTDAGGADAGVADAGAIDAGAPDAGAIDSGTAIDAGIDAGSFGTSMSFFVSSRPVFDTLGSATSGDISGDGNFIFTVPGSPPVVLRGVAAADAFCRSLALAVSSPRPTWVAYLSTHGLPEVAGGAPGPQIDARDRIGAGPWYNARGQVITDSRGNILTNATINVTLGVIVGEGRESNTPANAPAVAAYNAARPAPALIFMETGLALPLNVHDVVTGSDGDGRVYDGAYAERWSISQRMPPPGVRARWGTCNDWDWQRFGNAPNTDFAQIGHTDIPSGGFSPSWNSAHDTTSCTVNGLSSRGGAGHVYCFSPD